MSMPRALSCALLALALLAGCASKTNRAPVEQRPVGPPSATGMPAASTPSAPAPSASAVKPPPPGIENAGRPGYYTVRPGDTLIRIGLDNGQNWRDIARWNGLENPNLIEVGQVLRVVPPVPVAASATVATTQPVATGERTESRQLPGATGVPGASGVAPATLPAAHAASAAPPAATAPTVPAAAGTAAAVREGDEDVAWAWPAAGPVIGAFDEARNKGLAIGGKAGDAVLAAADGRVVYAGSGLRGYGNLVIVKHNNTFLTAYAHNQSLLVKDDQVVRRGQKIAEMGSTEAERVQLHFEIRRQGKPVDPARLLPAR
jgi:lipoprotein NlpD